MAKDIQKVRFEFVRHHLRRASLMWSPRNRARQAAKISYGVYICNICKAEFRAKDTELDHILPVVPLDSTFNDFNVFINRLLCDEDGFQVVCKVCHAEKTKKENGGRA